MDSLQAQRDDIRSVLTFLRDFADGCHHVKEEVIFFPALFQAGIAFQVRVMTYEWNTSTRRTTFSLIKQIRS